MRSTLLLGLALALWALGASVWAASLSVNVVQPPGVAPDDAVVMLESKSTRTSGKPAQGVEIIQQGREFKPRVSVVPVGTAVSFPNLDTVRHHVYSFSEAKPFELKLYVGRPEKPVVFDRPGVVILGCNIHDQMAAWVVVVDTPWAQRTDSRGAAQWHDLPEGEYRIRVWHTGMPPGHPGVEHTVRLNDSGPPVQVRVDTR